MTTSPAAQHLDASIGSIDQFGDAEIGYRGVPSRTNRCCSGELVTPLRPTVVTRLTVAAMRRVTGTEFGLVAGSVSLTAGLVVSRNLDRVIGPGPDR
jgi:hypothetical protein